MNAGTIFWFTVGVAWPVVFIVVERKTDPLPFPFWEDLVICSACSAVFATVLALAHALNPALCAGSAVTCLAALEAWWWNRRRPDKAARALGGKALARLAAMLETLRDRARPAPRPAWDGAG